MAFLVSSLSIPKLLCYLLGITLVAGCGIAPEKSNRLNDLYAGVASGEASERNPVILIPGILGSKLQDSQSGMEVWGAFVPGAANPNQASSARLIAIPMETGKPLSALNNGVVPAGVLDRIKLRLVPGVKISPKAYAQILGILGAGGYSDESLGRVGAINYGHDHYSCFQFSYDWRRSSAETAKQLHQFIMTKRSEVMAQRKKRGLPYKDIKFDIVAHSMGGLVARYYLRYGTQPLSETNQPKLNWQGARHIEKVVIVGSPHLGTPKALTQLSGGLRTTPFAPFYDPCLIGTMPSIYELLPRQRHGLLRSPDGQTSLDPLDPNVWTKFQWGLANPKYHATLKKLLPHISDPHDRIEVALDHQRKCLNNARQFHRAMDRPATPPPHLKIVTWVGDVGSTVTQLTAHSDKPKVSQKGQGDGSVPRFSAIADDRGDGPKQGSYRSPVAWHDINYLYRSHLDLTKDTNFSDNLLAFLLNQGGSVGSQN